MPRTRVPAPADSPARVAFLHPNLGIGGAERLVVDCASALQQSCCQVHLFTNYHDVGHCYPETRDGTLNVTVYGKMKDHLWGRFRVLIAIMRMIYLTIIFAIWHAKDFDVVVVDQVSHAIPILKWFTSCKVLFYCHFPDQLLSSRTSLLKRLYRWPFDYGEEYTTGCADTILVNSDFTRQTFRATFTRLQRLVDEGHVKVLYPSIDFNRYTTLTAEAVARLPETEKKEVKLLDQIVYGRATNSRAPPVHLLTSINRYERKKNISLAIDAFAQLYPSPTASTPDVRLLVCGGYDPVNLENRDHYLELVASAKRAGCTVIQLNNRTTGEGKEKRVTLEYAEPELANTINTQQGRIVYFLRSFTDLQRAWLLSHSTAVLYTPTNEHFGIVPIEAMFMRRPVIACRSGGPKESIVDWNAASERSASTGFLCEPDVGEWTDAMRTVVQHATADDANPTHRPNAMGERGHERVLQRFHFDAFKRQIVQHINETRRGTK